MYARYQNPEVITPSAIDSIQRIALGFYITMIVALGGIAFGMYKYQKDKVEKQGKDILTTIAIVTSNLKSFAIKSSTDVPVPASSFSNNSVIAFLKLSRVTLLVPLRALL